MTAGAQRFVGATTFSALASEPVQTSLWSRTDPIPHTTARPAGRPDRGGARHGTVPVGLRSRLQPRPAHLDAARHPGPGRGLPGDAHRDVGAPVGAGQPRHAAPSRGARGRARVRPAGRRRRRRRPAGGARGDRGRRSRAAARPERPGRAAGSSSPPAAPASRSTPCASSATAARASRATPSPRRRAVRGATVMLVTTTQLAGARPASSVVRGRDRGRDGGRGRPSTRRRADVVVMAAAVADFRPEAGRRPQDQEGRRCPRDRPRAHPRHPRRPRRRQARRPDPRRVRGRDVRRSAGQRPMEAGPRSVRISSSPTTSRLPAWGSSTTRMRCSSSLRSGREAEIGLTDKRLVARALLDVVIEERATRS